MVCIEPVDDRRGPRPASSATLTITRGGGGAGQRERREGPMGAATPFSATWGHTTAWMAQDCAGSGPGDPRVETKLRRLRGSKRIRG